MGRSRRVTTDQQSQPQSVGLELSQHSQAAAEEQVHAAVKPPEPDLQPTDMASATQTCNQVFPPTGSYLGRIPLDCHLQHPTQVGGGVLVEQ